MKKTTKTAEEMWDWFRTELEARHPGIHKDAGYFPWIEGWGRRFSYLGMRIRRKRIRKLG